MSMIVESAGNTRPSRFVMALSAATAFLTELHRGRRTLADLDAMEGHILRDIGLSRADVMRARFARPGTDRIAMLNQARRRNVG